MANRLVGPGITYLDDNGSPLSGGLLYFYESGSSSTAKATYSDSSLTSANANPVVLDSAGRVNGEVFGDGAYRLIIKDSGGVEINTFDPVGGDSVSSTASVFAADTGSADTYIISPNPAFSSLSEGNRFAFFAGNANTGASTLAVNENAAKAIQIQGAALTGGEIGAGDLVEVAYTSGGVFEIVNNPAFNVYQALYAVALEMRGGLTADTDSAYDIGATGTRFANIYGDSIYGQLAETQTRQTITQDLLVGTGLSDQGNGTINAENGFYLDNAAIYPIMAKGVFNGQTGATLKASGLSCSRISEGLYEITLSTAAPDVNYLVIPTLEANSGDERVYIGQTNDGYTKTTTKCYIKTWKSTGVVIDVDELHVAIVY